MYPVGVQTFRGDRAVCNALNGGCWPVGICGVLESAIVACGELLGGALIRDAIAELCIACNLVMLPCARMRALFT